MTPQQLKVHRECNRRWRLAHKERRDEQSKAYKRTLAGRFTGLKSSSKFRGLVLELSFEDYRYLMNFNCFYCAGPLDGSGGNLDRLNNAKGYIPGNVAPSCSRCNWTKGFIEAAGFTYPRNIELVQEVCHRQSI